MANLHQKASCKVSKCPEKKKAIGHPTQSIKLVIRKPAHLPSIGDQDDNNSESGCTTDNEPEEDELYGKVVSEDDGIDDDAVVSKPCRKGKKGHVDPRGVYKLEFLL
jgi:hypothetical protein